MMSSNRLWIRIQGVPSEYQKLGSFPVKPEVIEQKIFHQIMNNSMYWLPSNFQDPISNDSEIESLDIFGALLCISCSEHFRGKQ